MSLRRRRLDNDALGVERGQAAVEVALALPVLVVMLLAAVQVVVVARDQIAVVHAAREGARAAAVAPSPVPEAATAAREATGLDRGRLRVAVGGDDLVRVTVTYLAPTDVPLVGALVDDVTLTATAVMRREQPPW